MRSDSVFSTGSLQACFLLVLLCGIALALSIQPESPISALRVSDMSYSPDLFYLAFAFLFGLFAVNRGAVVAENASKWVSHLKLALRLLAHIAYGLLLLFPFLLFSRAFLSEHVFGLSFLILYTAVSSFFFCLASFRLELRGIQRKRSAFLLRYGLYIAFCLVPVGIGAAHPSLSLFPSASPIGLSSHIIEGASALELVIGFLVPIVGILWLFTRRRRFDWRHHAV